MPDVLAMMLAARAWTCVLVGLSGAEPPPAPMQMPAHIEHRGRASTPVAQADDASAPAGNAPHTPAPGDPLKAASALLDAGREREAEAALRAALVKASTRARAAEMLWTLDERRADSMPVDEAAAGALASTLGPGFVRFESPHVVMLSNARTDRVNARLGSLERTRSEFIKWARRTGLNPAPEPAKHLCVLLATRDEYVSFARDQDGLDATSLGGHYSPARERMALYADAPGLPASEGLTVRAIHEATHMVAFRTLTQTRRRTQPFWLTEGLAAAFEPTGDSPLAPDRAKPACREQFMRGREIKDAYVPIDTLVALTTPPREDPSGAAAMYRTSEALLRYLARHRKSELAAYMESIVTDEPGARSASELRAEFVGRFGDPATIERDMALRPW